MTPLTRRDFLKASATTLAAAGGLTAGGSLGAIEPIARPGAARLKLALAAYSFRQYFQEGRGEKQAGPAGQTTDMFRFVDYCAEHDCAAEVTSYYFPDGFDTEYLLRLKRHAFVRGVALSGTAVGNTFTLPVGQKRTDELAGVKRWIDHAATLGAPHIRVFAGGLSQGISKGQARVLTIDALEECCAYAASRGVFLGLENHGGIVAEPDDLLDIVRAVKSPWLGINLDSGNFHTADPYADLARCLPYAVNVQIKVELQARGKAKEPADLPRLAALLKEGRYQGFVALEYEAAADAWTAVPAFLDQLRALLR